MRDTKRVPLGQEINSAGPDDPPATPRAAGRQVEESAESPRISDEASEHSTDPSQSGSEEVVYRSDFPESNQVIATRIIISYSSFVLGVLMVQYLIAGVVLLRTDAANLADCSLIFLGFSVLAVFRVVLEVYYSVVNTINSLVHYKALLDAVGSLVVHHAIYCYLAGLYSFSFLLLSLVLNICLQFFRSFGFSGPVQRMPTSVLALLEAITFLLLFLKIEFPETEYTWSVALTLYTLVYYVLLYLSSAFTFVAVLLAVLYCFNVRNIRQVSNASVLVFVGLWLLVALASSAYCFGYIGLRALLENGAFGPHGTHLLGVPRELAVSGALMIALGAVGIIGIVVGLVWFKTEIIRKASNSVGKEITLKSYRKQIVLSLRHISGNFFRNERDTSEPSEPRDHSLDDCVVCQAHPSSFLLKPCNHCVLCEDCTRAYLEVQSKCPMCKADIDRALRIRVDAASRGFVSDAAFKVRVY